MSKVYIVTEPDYESNDIVAVYSSREIAQCHVDAEEAMRPTKRSFQAWSSPRYSIDEWEVHDSFDPSILDHPPLPRAPRDTPLAPHPLTPVILEELKRREEEVIHPRFGNEDDDV